MSLGIIAAVGLVILAVIVLLSLNYKSNEAVKCPHCQLDFTKDLFFLGQSTLVSCSFCHRWMVVTRMAERNVVKKLFEGFGRQSEET